ncbi:MsnO8 family LLM class oxidoreductase [Oceanobacillus sp. 1P07AA]|uniref:MsnO8 family LLM class oxidoreductase n=1 Tax=Oceanobacillus sp. 1P07AA TaxID=3132293 RepID=UPI0039A61874
MKLSILDQSPILDGASAKQALEETIELAKLADGKGYHRYWVAEHHGMAQLASPSPDILLAIIGSQTSTIRIGAGAVLLPNYRAFPVAERYQMLASLFPGRIDLGIGRAPGGSAEASIALAGDFLSKVKNMPTLIDELLHFLYDDFPEDNLYSKIDISPQSPEPPQPWLLGTSERSAVLAAEKKLAYVFGHFMTDSDGPKITRKYQHLTGNTKPIIVAVSVICGETEEEAFQLAKEASMWNQKDTSIEEDNQNNDIFSNMIIGDPVQVKEQLQTLQQLYQCDELMILTITSNYQDRKKSYERIANICL